MELTITNFSHDDAYLDFLLNEDGDEAPPLDELHRNRAMWHNRIMPTRSSKLKERDFMAVGRRVVEQAIGEKLSGEPLDDPNAGKNPAAVALGRLGGVKGGRARAQALTPKQRSRIARIAAQARWKKTD